MQSLGLESIILIVGHPLMTLMMILTVTNLWSYLLLSFQPPLHPPSSQRVPRYVHTGHINFLKSRQSFRQVLCCRPYKDLSGFYYICYGREAHGGKKRQNWMEVRMRKIFHGGSWTVYCTIACHHARMQSTFLHLQTEFCC